MSLPLSGLLSDSALLEELLRFIPEGLTIATAPDVEIPAVSDFGRQLTGRTELDLIGETAEQHPTTWQIYHLDGRTLARPEELPLTRATVEGEVVVNEPWILRKPDGTDLRILCNAGPIRDATGAIRWGIIAWRDVTALHEAEAALAREREQAARAHEALLAEAHHRIKNNLTLVPACCVWRPGPRRRRRRENSSARAPTGSSPSVNSTTCSKRATVSVSSISRPICRSS